MKTASWADTANGVVVTLVGEIDFATAGDLMGVVGEVFSQRHPAEVRVDVRAMPFIDSTGLSALISLYRAALAADARLVLVDPAPFLVTLLQITGLVELFPVESSEAGAAPAGVAPPGADVPGAGGTDPDVGLPEGVGSPEPSV
ncbi:MAG TPA: STAS domain-containing protein [Catenuloplanes sp.]